MQLIILTLPTFFEAEAKAINVLMDQDDFILHIRKPHASTQAIGTLLNQINKEYYSRIVLHDCFDLAHHNPVKGVHLNRRNPEPPFGFEGSISRSCHSWEEVKTYRDHCHYLFISPLFDSLSKPGYKQAFSKEELEQAQQRGWLDKRIVGLGGITPERISLLASYGLGGVAVLGYIWQDFANYPDFYSLQERLKACKLQTQKYG